MDPQIVSLVNSLSGLQLNTQEGKSDAAREIVAAITSARAASQYKAPKPQLFRGGRDALVTRDWLEEVERYCRRTNLLTTEWTGAATDYLRGPALTWYRMSVLTENTTWEDFKEAFTAEFKPSNHEHTILTELRDLRQASILEFDAYVTKFRNLALQLDNPADNMLREYFISGLTLKTQLQVQIANPLTWQNAIQVAERINNVFARSTTNKSNHPVPIIPSQATTRTSGPEPMDLDHLRVLLASLTNTTNVNAFQRPLSKLTRTERDRLRRIGACFRCRRTGHLASECRSGRNLNNIETDASADDESGKDQGEA